MATTANDALPVAAVLEQHGDDGALQSRTETLDGVPHGQMTRFGPGGKPAMQAAYQAGVLHGVLRAWDDEGRLVREALYSKGLQHGPARVYEGGTLLSEQMFVGGVLHGDTTTYAPSGDPTCRMRFQQGEIEGETLFFADGDVIRRVPYRKGLIEGEAIDYDREGAKVQTAHYKANLLDGWLRRYWPNGQVMEELKYRQGKPLGKPRRFSLKGSEIDDEAARMSLMQRLEKLVRG